MATLTLTYKDLRDAIYERRFPQSAPAPQWLAAAYTDVWNAEPWSFKHVSRATWFTTVDGLSNGTASATPKMPTSFARARSVFDSNGDELCELPPKEFERYYTPGSVSGATGLPEAWTVVNRQVYLGPKPDSAYPFLLSYERRLATRTAAGAVQEGFFQADDDVPLWDDHHYILVMRAKIIGLRDRSDPTASDLVEEYSRLMAAMAEDYTDRPVGIWTPAWP